MSLLLLDDGELTALDGTYVRGREVDGSSRPTRLS